MSEPSEQSEERARNELRMFVTENFKHRRCNRYIQSDSNTGICGCGLKQKNHDAASTVQSMDNITRWNTKDHTTTIEADSFGEISFTGFGQELPINAPYIRLDETMQQSDESLKKVWDLLSQHWGVAPPQIIVSVTGGAQSLFLEDQRKTSFKHGLMNVAKMPGAWIITGGTGVGVMKFVGEAVREHQLTTADSANTKSQVVALGIATWGIIDCREGLTAEEGEGNFPVTYAFEDLGKERRTAPLDQNHTHFLLVDDGTNCQFGKEITFRAKFEHYISNKSIEGVHVPVVLLVLEGGVNTLQTVHKALEKGTPVVVIHGSGRAADFIALAYEDIQGWEKDTRRILDERIQRKRARQLFEECKVEENVDKVIQLLQKILSHELRPKVTVFRMDDSTEIDEAILYAQSKDTQTNAQQQLNLALGWRRCGVARQTIFNRKNRSRRQELDLTEPMFNALLQNQPEFVQLFIDNGVDLRKFLPRTTLRKLYDKAINGSPGPAASLLKYLLEVAQTSSFYCLNSIRPSEETHEDDKLLTEVGRVIMKLHGEHQGNRYATTKEKDSPERDLFLWAVLLDRQELARLFWKADRDHIGGALVACSMLKSLGQQAEDNEEFALSQDLYKHSDEWEELAVGVLNNCYERDKEKSHQLLIRDIPTWENTTLFIMADSARQMDFMSHSCCQTKLNRIWMGRMALYTPLWKILLCMFLPVFLRLIRFPPGEYGPAPRTDPRSPPHRTNRVWPQGREQEKKVTMLDNVFNYYQAPITKFCFHTFSYVVFLGLFSYFVLVDLSPVNVRPPSTSAYIVWVWAATLLIEEVRQLMMKEYMAFSDKLAEYFENTWNRFDISIHVMLVVSIILNYVLQGANFVWCRMFYTVTLAMYFLRFLHFFFVGKRIGPKVIMVGRMLTDIAFFLAILLTVMLAYGVSVQALRFPNSPPNISLLGEVFYKPYWHIYGELFLDDLEGDVDNCSGNETVWRNASSGMTRCPQRNALVIVMLGAYMMITNILLLNLLIAMFSYTFSHVQQKSEKVWCYYLYSLMDEYIEKPALAPPLIIISHVVGLVRFCINGADWSGAYRSSYLRWTMDSSKNNALTAFERFGMEDFLRKQQRTEREESDGKIDRMSNRLRLMEETLMSIDQRLKEVSAATRPANDVHSVTEHIR